MTHRSFLLTPLLILGAALTAQDAAGSSPVAIMEELAAKDFQPSQATGVSPRTRANLERLKGRLGPWILGRLTALGAGTTPELGQRLSQDLDAVAAKAPNPGESFWHPLRFQVETPEPHAELLAVTARFGIDATLLLFRRGEGGWRLLWQDRAPVYEDIDAAFGDYTTVMTPKGADGAFFLAAARITPWYQSWWRGAELRVFRIGPGGEVKKIGQREETVYLGNDDPMSLSAVDAQHLRFKVRAGSSDPGRHTFLRTFHFQPGPGGLRRVPPYAETPLDLVEEWLSLPWKEALALLDPPLRSKLKALHARLGDRENSLLTFDEAPNGDAGAGTWTIGAELERDDQVETISFRVGSSDEGLRLLEVQSLRKP